MGKKRVIASGITLAICLTAILFCYYWRFLSNQQSPYLLDIGAQQQPYLGYIGESLREGKVPLWNPYMNCGVPHFGKMSPSALNPFDAILSLIPFNCAYALKMVLNHLIGGMGAYLMVLSLGWGSAAAIFCAMAFGLSSFLFSLQINSLVMTTAALYPLAIWSFLQMRHHSANRVRAIYCLIGGCIMYCMLTSAPDLALIEIATLVLGCSFNWLKSPTRDNRLLLWWFISAAVAGLLSMAQMVPLLEWIGHSIRTSAFGSDTVLRWSANWYDLLGAILPQPLGDSELATFRYLPLISGPGLDAPYIASLFLGPVIITLAFIGFADKQWRWRWQALGVLVFFTALSLGANLALIGSLVKLLHWQLIRYPMKLTVFPTLLMLIAAARGLKATGPQAGRSLPLAPAAFWLGTGIAAAAGLLCAVPAGTILSRTLSVSDVGLTTEALIALCRSMLGISTLGFALCALIGLVRRQLFGRRAFEYLCIATTSALSLWLAATTLWHGAPASFFTHGTVLESALHSAAGTRKSNGPIRLLNLTQAPIYPAVCYQTEDPTVNCAQYNRQMLKPFTNMAAHVASAVFCDPAAETADHAVLIAALLRGSDGGDDLPMASYCRLTATEFAVQFIDQPSENGQTQRGARLLDSRFFAPLEENRAFNYRLYRVLNVLPRVRFATAIKWGHPHEAVLEFIAGKDGLRFDPYQLTVLEHSEENGKGPNIGSHPRLGTTTITVDDPELIRIQASTPEDNYLVLADTFYPGWIARVDGKTTAIVRADGILRAVFVPSGRHTVEFCYSPTSFKMGLLLSGFGVILSCALLALAVLWKEPSMSTDGTIERPDPS